MECFHNFTAPLWELFAGNLLLLLCSLFYLAWWVVVFRPGPSAGASGKAGALLLAAALVAGLSAVVLMSAGIGPLSQQSKALPVRFILLGCAVLYAVLLPVTAKALHRPVTSELLIMLIWAALELSAVAVLNGTGRFGLWRAALLAALAAAATVAGLVCYVLYYRLAGMQSYWDGMVPLAADACVMAVFLGVMAVS